MAFSKANKDRNTEKRNVSSTAPGTSDSAVVFAQCAEAFLGTRRVRTRLLDSGVDACQEFVRMGEGAASGESGPTQTLFFQKNANDKFLLAAPTATILILLDAFLGIDADRLCADDALWRDFCASVKQNPALTELEREIFLGDAPRLGTLNPEWFDAAIAGGSEEAPWKTRFLETNLQRGVDYLGAENLRWERRAFELEGRVFPWTLVLPASVPDPVAESAPESVPEPAPVDVGEPISLRSLIEEPLDERADEEKTMIVRIASGTIDSAAWTALRPGDVLTTDVPADRLFDAIVDDKVVFHVRPGLFHGRPAIQIKERVS